MHVFVSVCVYLHTRECVCTCVLFVCVVCVRACVHIHGYMLVCMYMHVCRHVRVCMCVCAYLCML